MVSPSVEGTPQGGPLSPLLSNLVPDELDRELERRGHRFVRFADDCNIYVRSERAGQRVMESVTQFITQKLKLKVNEAKSAVARPQRRKFLGFSFTAGPEVKRVIAPKATAAVDGRTCQSRSANRREVSQHNGELLPVGRSQRRIPCSFRVGGSRCHIHGQSRVCGDEAEGKPGPSSWRRWARSGARAGFDS